MFVTKKSLGKRNIKYIIFTEEIQREILETEYINSYKLFSKIFFAGYYVFNNEEKNRRDIICDEIVSWDHLYNDLCHMINYVKWKSLQKKDLDKVIILKPITLTYLKKFTNHLIEELYSNSNETIFINIPPRKERTKPCLIFIQLVSFRDALSTCRINDWNNCADDTMVLRIYNPHQMMKRQGEPPLICLPCLKNGTNMSKEGKYDPSLNCLVFRNARAGLYQILESLPCSIEDIGIAVYKHIGFVQSFYNIQREDLLLNQTNTYVRIRSYDRRAYVVQTLSVNAWKKCVKKFILCMNLSFLSNDIIDYICTDYMFHYKFL